MCFPEMSAELTASQKQVELLQTRLTTTEDQVENLEAGREGNYTRIMFSLCMYERRVLKHFELY